MGQLERWVPELGGHGTKWLTDALAGGLQTRPETPVWEFVASVAGAFYVAADPRPGLLRAAKCQHRLELSPTSEAFRARPPRSNDRISIGPLCSAALGTPLVPGTTARIVPSGDAAAPADAPVVVQEMIAAGNRIDRFPYSFAGGHGAVAQTMNQTRPDPAAFPGAQENGSPGYDCSSATDYVLYGGGFGQTLLQGSAPASTTLESVGDPGPGRWVTIYANAGHAYIEVAGIYLDTAAGEGNPPNPPGTGPRWTVVGTGPEGFIARHPPGL